MPELAEAQARSLDKRNRSGREPAATLKHPLRTLTNRCAPNTFQDPLARNSVGVDLDRNNSVGSLFDGDRRGELQIEIGIGFAAHREIRRQFRAGPKHRLGHQLDRFLSLVVLLDLLSRDPAAGDPGHGVVGVQVIHRVAAMRDLIEHAAIGVDREVLLALDAANERADSPCQRSP